MNDAANEDICDVLGQLLADGPSAIELDTLRAFAADHAHHPSRLPQLLRELAA